MFNGFDSSVSNLFTTGLKAELRGRVLMNRHKVLGSIIVQNNKPNIHRHAHPAQIHLPRLATTLPPSQVLLCTHSAELTKRH